MPYHADLINSIDKYMMRNFMNIVESTLEEAGAGPARIASHIRNGTPFFMISAMRADKGPENAKRTEMLRGQLAKFPGVSFVEVDGEYQEDGQDEPSKEISFFVMPRSKNTNTQKFLEVGKKLRTVFGQDAVIIGDGETIKLVGEGWSDDLGDTATFNPSIIKTLPGYSKIKKRAFSFTSSDNTPDGVQYGAERKAS